MPAIDVDVSGDHEAVGKRVGTDTLPVIHTLENWTLDALEHGMKSGATSIMLMIPVEVSGQRALVMAETSLTCWISAAAILAAKFRDEVEQPGWAKLSTVAKDLLRPRYAEAIRRAIPSATDEQALEAAEMMFSAMGADAPPDVDEPGDPR